MLYSREIPVAGEYDVIVCGGGPSGLAAALAAAEKGAKTVLIERFGFLGGMATAGYVDPISEFAYNGSRVIGGIPWRFVEELKAAGGALVEEPRCNVSFSPEIYKIVAKRMLDRSGAESFMNTVLIDCIRREDSIESVIIHNRSGIQALKGKYFIDATGDADLSAYAGAEMLPDNPMRQPGTLCFILSGVDTSTERMHIMHQKNHRFNHQAVFVRETLFALREQGVHVPQFGGPWLCTTLNEGSITVNMTRSPMDSTDSVSYAEAEYRMQEDAFTLVDLLKKHVPEFKNCWISSLAPVAGIRESRRIKGVHVLTSGEYSETVKFPDSIARACHPIDIHLPGNEGQKLIFPKDAGYIPYRSLITPDIRNLIVAGRCISSDPEAFAAIRVQAPCMEIGQAAGTAAALCLKSGDCAVQDLDASELVAQVRELGSFV